MQVANTGLVPMESWYPAPHGWGREARQLWVHSRNYPGLSQQGAMDGAKGATGETWADKWMLDASPRSRLKQFTSQLLLKHHISPKRG